MEFDHVAAASHAADELWKSALELNALRQDVHDFFKAIDAGWIGPMPQFFEESAYVKALRDQIKPK